MGNKSSQPSATLNLDSSSRYQYSHPSHTSVHTLPRPQPHLQLSYQARNAGVPEWNTPITTDLQPYAYHYAAHTFGTENIIPKNFAAAPIHVHLPHDFNIQPFVGIPLCVREHTGQQQRTRTFRSASRGHISPPEIPLQQNLLVQPTQPPIRDRSTSSESNQEYTQTATESLWRTILNYTYEVGEACVAKHIIPKNDLESLEPYLFLGLPALTVSHLVYRSLDYPDELLCISDRTLTLENVDTSEARALIENIPAAKQKFREIRDTSADFELEWQDLQRRIVAESPSEGDYQGRVYSAERVMLHNQIRSSMHNVATPLTQTNVFRKNFQNVLEMLAALKTDDSISQRQYASDSIRSMVDESSRRGEIDEVDFSALMVIPPNNVVMFVLD